MGKIILYHGSPDETVTPRFELGEEKRDVQARENMRKLIDSDRNRVTRVFSTLL